MFFILRLQKILVFFILLFITSTSIFASFYNSDNSNRYIGLRSGYSTSFITLFDRDIYLNGPSFSVISDSCKKTSINHSLSFDYSISFVKGCINDYNINGNQPNGMVVDSYVGVKQFLSLNDKFRLYSSLGIHSNMIMVESIETLWILYDMGFFTNPGISYNLTDTLIFDFGLKASIDFFNFYITDFSFEEDFYDNMDPYHPFLGINGCGYISLLYKY